MYVKGVEQNDDGATRATRAKKKVGVKKKWEQNQIYLFARVNCKLNADRLPVQTLLFI